MNFAIIAGVNATALVVADQLFSLEDGGVPSIVFVIARYIIAIATTLGLSAKMTTTTPNEL